MRPNVHVPSDLIAILGHPSSGSDKVLLVTESVLAASLDVLCGARYGWVVWVRQPTDDEYANIMPMIYTSRRPTQLGPPRNLDEMCTQIAANQFPNP